MTYRDRLRPGSFRGVPFKTPTHETEGGRRGVVHEYPKSDKHSTQDLGKAARRFTVTAWIIGDDYDVDRDRLIDALEKGGAGKLVHRYFGEMQAEIEPGKTYRLIETEDEGRKAVFTIPFVRAGDSKTPTIGIDSVAKVKSAADRAKIASKASFAKKVITSGPEFVRTDVIGSIARANAVVSGINNKVSSTLAVTTGVPALIKALGNNVATLVASPLRVTELADQFYAITEAVFDAVATVGRAFKRVANAVGIGGGSTSGVATTTPSVTSATGLGVTPAVKAQIQADASASAAASATAAAGGGPASSRATQSSVAAAAQTDGRKIVKTNRQAQAEAQTSLGVGEPAINTATALGAQRAQNQAAVVALSRQATTIEAVRAAVDMPYDSHLTAIATRDQLNDALIAIAEESNDDDVYAALVDLRVEIHKHLTQAAGELPRILPYTPLVTIPSVLLAHLAHGDATRCEEIISRNNIRHPGFVPGGVALQILSDG
jgi:prophage DNA circulation protein